MKRRKKIVLIAGALLLLVIILGVTISQSRKNVAVVQTAKVQRQDLVSVVTASGEIKPKTYVNIGANAFGKIVKLHVREGEHVKKGQILAQLENVQSAADVAATQASLAATETDALAAAAAYKTASAELKRAQADAERTRLDFERAEELYKAQLIPKSEYDARKTAYEAAAAGLAQAEARIAQMQAQEASARERVRQIRATLTRASDVLSKTSYVAPFDGVITNLPVREGETVVIGIQNSPGSTLMTLADMSVITAEAKVDETDIVNVKLGQAAKVTIDALPKQEFSGTVTEIGNNAVIRSTGLATSQTTIASQEAKDFKVVVTLASPPQNLRPGLSATAKITTATRDDAMAIPIQALTIRQRGDLEETDKNGTVRAAESANGPKEKERKKEELQGVFVVRNKRAEFVPVETGITGVTDIEVLGGLKDGDEIITGSYKILRSLRNGASVKVDNAAPEKPEEQT
jgi:HlyD family secretion protein